ncbi:hypothetical protein GNIT_1177 [Glaciecola nitratireducens FR1064]|uniref:Uncharacterized protein n=1 Tax=Glaciecola nitratireducens (strain JCM 12485 / KCTC 12276 / FR1064) TaxID=1085623 RepID=G4QKA5_GLANF|nr:hypothetical protein GNIT_1177 [Glaciecola nitratireducens FR1064]
MGLLLIMHIKLYNIRARKKFAATIAKNTELIRANMNIANFSHHHHMNA